MKLIRAAVLEPRKAQRMQIAEGLKRAGLKVSSATGPQGLSKEEVIVLGPGLAQAAKVARMVRSRFPQALLLAARSRGFKAAFADAVLPLPVSPNDLKVRLPELAALLHRSTASRPESEGGILDPNTSFFTFTHFKEVLFIEVKRSRRYGLPLSIALIGLDPLGHLLSPELFSRLMGGVAVAIRRSLRDTDYPVQYRADRVILLMPHTDLSGAFVVARRICERVAKVALSDGGEILRPTLSAGVASGVPGREYGFADLIRKAQSALTGAMAHGGNRVELGSGAVLPTSEPSETG